MPQRFNRTMVDQLEIVRSDGLVLRNCREHPVYGLTQFDYLCKAATRFRRVLQRKFAKPVGLLLRDHFGLTKQRDNIQVAFEVIFPPLRVVTTADGVREVESQLSAGEVKLKFRFLRR